LHTAVVMRWFKCRTKVHAVYFIYYAHWVRLHFTWISQ
jgi:hypothetical protein